MKRTTTSKKPVFRSRRYCRRGYLYLAVMIVAVIVSIVGLSALQIARLELRIAENDSDGSHARRNSLSAVEHALAVMSQSDWRNTYSNDVEETAYFDSSQSIAWKLVDEDGDLADDPNDPVTVQGMGRCDNMVWVYGVIFEPSLNGGLGGIQPASWQRLPAPQ